MRCGVNEVDMAGHGPTLLAKGDGENGIFEVTIVVALLVVFFTRGHNLIYMMHADPARTVPYTS